MRPLPQDMLKYAREDTHYLLYIYDCLRKQLKEAGTALNPENSLVLMRDALHRSASLCLKVYEKPEPKGFDYYRTIANSRHITGINRLRVLKMVLKWRDYIARIDDESIAYMLPNHILFQIVQDLPTTRNELRDCRRASAEPPALQKYGEQLLQLITQKLNTKSKKCTAPVSLLDQPKSTKGLPEDQSQKKV